MSETERDVYNPYKRIMEISWNVKFMSFYRNISHVLYT